MESAPPRNTPTSRHSLRRKPARATLLTKRSGASGRFSGHPASTQPSLTPPLGRCASLRDCRATLDSAADQDRLVIGEADKEWSVWRWSR